jgi:ABC-type Mn2+/Zn2+ transport system ATPase subunit
MIEPFPNKIKIKYEQSEHETVVSTENRCILLDEPLVATEAEDKQKFVEWIKKEFDQAIIVSRDENFSRFDAETNKLQSTRT